MDDYLGESGKSVMDLNVEPSSKTKSLEFGSSSHVSNDTGNLTLGKGINWNDDLFFRKDPFQLTARDFEGIEFNSLNDVEMFYMAYAHIIGFYVQVGGSLKDKHQNVVGKYFCCDNGLRWEKLLKSENRIRKPKLIIRTGCKVKMRVVLNKRTQRWVVSVFDKEHNHELPSQNSLNQVVPMGANARDDITPSFHSLLDDVAIQRLRYSFLTLKCQKLCYLGSQSEAAYEYVLAVFDNMTSQLLEDMVGASTVNRQNGEAEPVQDPPSNGEIILEDSDSAYHTSDDELYENGCHCPDIYSD